MSRYSAAIEACCLDVDVAALSDGHSTVIGDRGTTLSGGQRQRVSLARAVYSDSDIYLLDDPLASIDPDVALTVFRRVVLNLLNDKTVLLVTHQPQVTDVCQMTLHCKRCLERHEVKLLRFFTRTEYTIITATDHRNDYYYFLFIFSLVKTRVGKN